MIVAELAGDANNDGKLDVRDAAYIARMLAQRDTEKFPAKADFNRDGKVDVRDAAAIARSLAFIQVTSNWIKTKGEENEI